MCSTYILPPESFAVVTDCKPCTSSSDAAPQASDWGLQAAERRGRCGGVGRGARRRRSARCRRRRGRRRSPGWRIAESTKVDNQYAFGMALSLNLTLHDYDNPSASHILDIEVVGNTLVVIGWLGGIDFYDISDPSVLNHLTNFNLGGGGGGGSKPICASASGNYLYVTSSNGVAILNISNPSNPVGRSCKGRL